MKVAGVSARWLKLCFVCFVSTWMAAAEASGGQEQDLDFQGLEKLGILETKVPNLLRRPSIKVGQWLEYDVRVKSSTDKLDMRFTWRSRVTEVTDDEITVQHEYLDESREETLDRVHHFFAKEAIETSLRNAGIEEGLRTVRIVEVKLPRTETLAVMGRRLECNRASISMDLEFQMESPETGEAVSAAGRLEMTYWYHESIPLTGIAQALVEARMSQAKGTKNEPLGTVTSKQTIRSFGEDEK